MLRAKGGHNPVSAFLVVGDVLFDNITVAVIDTMVSVNARGRYS